MKSLRDMSMNYVCRAILISGLVFLSVAGADEQSLTRQRQDFLRAERMVEQGNDAAFLALSAALTDYPLYPYLQYQWLKNHLQKTDKVLAFLANNKESRYAGLLRDKWLDYLAGQERWQEFIRYYETDANTARECQFYWALYQTGYKQQAIDAAKRLWTVGNAQPKACDSLLSALIRSPVFTRDLIWRRFELALKNDNYVLADYVRRLLDKSDQKVADFWLQVHKKPLLTRNSGLWMSNDAQIGRIFADGVEQLIILDLELAIQVWEGRKRYSVIEKEHAEHIDKKLAMALAHHRDSRAYYHLNRLADIDDKVREAKVRAALLEQNWQHVADALTALTAKELQGVGWQYWLARSLAMTGKAEEAKIVYTRLAEDRSFYGFLAADTVGKSYHLIDKPVAFAENELEALANQTDFKVVQELKVLDRETEARRQWWFAVNKLNKEQLMIAAKLAQQWLWDQIAIITLVKADYWDDVALRFPLRYLPEVRSNAALQQIDPAIILGLIRQESLLDSKALSPVGAQGLMQVMPNTARQIADKLDETWRSDAGLFNPAVNIRYGSYYFAELLNRFNGHFALAAAAYNAGPSRIMKWLPPDKSVPADIWIETIPFKETRKYVTSVFSYAIIYQQRLQTNRLRIKNMLPDVLRR